MHMQFWAWAWLWKGRGISAAKPDAESLMPIANMSVCTQLLSETNSGQGQPKFSFGRLDQASASYLCKRHLSLRSESNQSRGVLMHWHALTMCLFQFVSGEDALFVPHFQVFISEVAQVLWFSARPLSSNNCDTLSVLAPPVWNIQFLVDFTRIAKIVQEISVQFWFWSVYEATRAGAEDVFLLHCSELAMAWELSLPRG